MSGARYLYCIVDSDKPAVLKSPGVGQGPQVSLMGKAGLGVMISECLPDECETNRTNLINHQKVLEESMGRFTVLPIRYGTIALETKAENAEALVERKVLQDREKELRALLAKMAGKQEFSVKVLWRNLDEVLKDIGQKDAEIRKMAQKIAKLSEAASRPHRIQMGGLVQAALYRRRDAYAKEFSSSISAHSVDSRVHAPLGDRMVLNGAFLIEERKRDALIKCVDALSQKHEALTFRCTGPLAPCSFINLVIDLDGK